MNGGAAASSSPKQTVKKPNGAKYLRQNEHSLFYDNLCLLIRRNGSIATQGRPDGVPAKNFLLQSYEELVEKRVYLIGSLLSLYLFCADGHDFLPVAKARLKDTRSNTDGDAMRALFLKSPMAEPYVRQAMEYYQRLIHVQNGQPNGNTVEDAVVRVLESLADVSEEDRKILSQNKNFIRHLEAFAETAAGRDAKGQAYDNALIIACILLSVPALLVDDKDVSVLLPSGADAVPIPPNGLCFPQPRPKIFALLPARDSRRFVAAVDTYCAV